jgi:RNAse (barnase) inhibitor barstar
MERRVWKGTSKRRRKVRPEADNVVSTLQRVRGILEGALRQQLEASLR